MRKLLFISLLLLGATFKGNSQKINPGYTFNVELGLPSATSNESFDDIMQGLVTANVYGQYTFPFHLNVGAGLKYSYFAVNQFSVPTPVFGGIHSGGAFVKVGYDKFYSNRFAMDYGVKIGYMDNFMLTDVNKTIGAHPVHVQSVVVEPTVGFILTADERNSYRLNIGYTIYGYGFQPTMLGLESNGAYQNDNLNNATQYFFVGFGYTFYFGVKGGE